jgi:hypothetical protein
MKNCIVLISLLSLIGCSSTKYTSNGAQDNRPLLFEDEYELSELNEINLDGSAFWGIPLSSKSPTNKQSGFLFTINGLAINKSTKILPILGMIGYTGAIGYGLNILAGDKLVMDGGYYDAYNVFNPYYTSKSRLPLVPAFIISVPIAGTLNNLTFRNSALNSAGSSLYYKLITENPDVDLFFYPKYTFNNNLSIWGQKATLSANFMGAKLKLD